MLLGKKLLESEQTLVNLLCPSRQWNFPSSGIHLQVRRSVWVMLTFQVRRGNSILSARHILFLPFASLATKSVRAHLLGDLLTSYRIHCLSRRCFACWNNARQISEKSPSVVWHPECHEVAKSLIQSVWAGFLLQAHFHWTQLVLEEHRSMRCQTACSSLNPCFFSADDLTSQWAVW